MALQNEQFFFDVMDVLVEAESNEKAPLELMTIHVTEAYDKRHDYATQLRVAAGILNSEADVSRFGSYTHPDDVAYQEKMMEWLELGDPKTGGGLSFYQDCCVITPGDSKAVLEAMNILEAECRERYPNAPIKFFKPEVKSGGCYIATAVYGSYDCPEVWTLRRYRDEKLLQTSAGRMFVKAYYVTSPTVVKLFGKTEWFNRFWRGRLNKMVENLKAEGYEDTPYYDR